MISLLWAPEDERAETGLLEAGGADDLLGAMIAIEGLEGDEAGYARATVRAWGNEVRHLNSQRGPHLALDTMRQVLVDGAGLDGDRQDYHDPSNSFLSSVLRRRRGLPIALSAIWMEVGRMAGVAVEGVGMPGHFIVRVESRFCDPYGAGRSLSR
jgi:regulator of sirC expression with transglutaminase-like and TPR domain